MHRTLQPLALAIGVGTLIGLRLLLGADPLAEAVDKFLRRDAAAGIAADSAQVASLEAKIAVLENELGFQRSSQLELAPANVINKTSASFRQIIKIDRGRSDGVAEDQPVLADGHLVGLVLEADEFSATVILLGDPDLNIPVTIGDAAGIATAKAGGLVVSQLNDGGRARSGQAVVTSGLGGLYPPGLVVGRLGARLSSDILSEFVLERPFDLASLQVVLVAVGP